MLELLFFVPRHQRIHFLLYLGQDSREYIKIKWCLLSRPDPMQLDFSSLIECDPDKELMAKNFVATDHFSVRPLKQADMHESYDTLAYDPENQYLYVSGNYSKLVQIDINTKKELNVMHLHGDVYASVVVGECLYVTQERQFYCLDKKTLAVHKNDVLS